MTDKTDRELLVLAVLNGCPYRIHPDTFKGCCEWLTFIDGFASSWTKFFKELPDRAQWTPAKRDWLAGNTGYEAAHNAWRRSEDAKMKGQTMRPSRAKEIASATIARAAAAVGEGM